MTIITYYYVQIEISFVTRVQTHTFVCNFFQFCLPILMVTYLTTISRHMVQVNELIIMGVCIGVIVVHLLMFTSKNPYRWSNILAFPKNYMAGDISKRQFLAHLVSSFAFAVHRKGIYHFVTHKAKYILHISGQNTGVFSLWQQQYLGDRKND